MRKDKDAIQRLQRNLATLRMVAGWSSAALADLLGVSRPTVVSLENGKNGSMTTIQYLAIRALLQEEIDENRNTALGQVVDLLVDDDKASDQKREMVTSLIWTVAKAKGRHVGVKEIGKEAAAQVLDFLQTPVSELPKPSPEKVAAILEIIKDRPVSSIKKGGEMDE